MRGVRKEMITITEPHSVTLARLRAIRKELGSPDVMVVTVNAELIPVVCDLPGFVGRKHYTRTDAICIDEFGTVERFRFRCHIPDGGPWKTEAMRVTSYDPVSVCVRMDAK